MMAASKKMLEQEPSEIEMLLPFHAAGTLSARDARRVEDALASDPELARQFAVIREEYAETISLNESLGAPSARAMQKLFAAIDAEPERKPSAVGESVRRISEFFARLSPRTLAWSASLGAIALLLQAGVIGAVLMNNQTASFQTASLEPERAASAPITRDLGSSARPDARAGSVRAGGQGRRYHGLARHLSGLDRRRRQGRHVPPAVRQGDGQGRSRRRNRPAAAREDRQPRGAAP